MTRLVVDDPVIEQMMRDVYELIRPNCTFTVGNLLVCVTPHVGAGVEE